MASLSNFIYGWIYSNGNIINGAVKDVKYDKIVTKLVKFNFSLKYQRYIESIECKVIDGCRYV